MAAPTDPTIDLICTEAYKKAGILSPTSAQVTRAKDYFLEEVLDDIWNRAAQDGNLRLKSLQSTTVSISTKGKRSYDMAEDFDEEFSVTIWDGSNRGTAQAGGATSITLASDETITEARILGKFILVTGGTGSAGYKQVTAYNTTTKVATVDSAWTTNPDATSTYLIVERTWDLDEEHDHDLTQNQPAAIGIPTSFGKYGRQLWFDRAFDKSTYGIAIKYFMNIHQVDRVEGASTIITRLLRNWRKAITYGITLSILESEGDASDDKIERRYERAVQNLLVREIPYGGEFTGFTLK